MPDADQLAEDVAEHPRYNGADHLIANAVHNGVTVCFANPGTTELHLVAALDANPHMRTVLCTFEGVASGAADAYARMAGVPALGLYHLGPGFANSLANQHNARRHFSPMVNVIGDQATFHLEHDAPLTSRIDLLGDWAGDTRATRSPEDAGAQVARAIGDVLSAAPRAVNLVVPADHAWNPAHPNVHRAHVAPRPPASTEAVAEAAARLQQPGAALIVSGASVSEQAAVLLGRIRHRTGCAVHLVRTPRLETGSVLPDLHELPYFHQPLLKALAGVTTAVMVGHEPVTFFGYPDTPSLALPDDAERMLLCGETGDIDTSLAALADALGAVADEPRANGGLPELADGPLDTSSLSLAVARALRPGHIVVNESLTSAGRYRKLAQHAAPHTLLGVLGGAIGGGLPAAVGAAVACPDRPVLALQADGSALYTIQSLWTMARERLDVTVVLLSNQRYNILDIELADAGLELSERGKAMTSLADPPMSFAKLAEGFGVPARTVATTGDLADALDWAIDGAGPHLVEALLP
ncbi:MAG TPA: acetolactate synthase large subunit [Ilumatobacter sp.]|nr:acetolactate synthase large subunit [Ilumatobacter sp.]